VDLAEVLVNRVLLVDLVLREDLDQQDQQETWEDLENLDQLVLWGHLDLQDLEEKEDQVALLEVRVLQGLLGPRGHLGHEVDQESVGKLVLLVK